MKGDFSKLTFAPDKNFLRVLMQQGRVQLDADWNEQAAILLHYMQALATDLIGPYAGPAGENFGFTLTSVVGNAGIGNFIIGKGRYYVDGMLCENHSNDVTYLTQADYPLDAKRDALESGKYLAYLDVWERHISYLEDDAIRETALNGVDTATRSKVIWQVKTLLLPVDGQSWQDLLNEQLVLSEACLLARVKPEDGEADACCQHPDVKYRGVENQLYRIEIHNPGDASNESLPTFKWSRENGAVAFPVTNIIANTTAKTVTVMLENLGRDAKLGLAVNDWVELLDDDTVLKNDTDPLPLCQVYSIDQLTKTVVLTGASPVIYDETKHPLLRRWDQKGDVKKLVDGIVIETASWMPIEAGIEVKFALNGPLKTGDYWLIPARTNTGTVEWPLKLDENGQPVKDEHGLAVPAAKRPLGVEHHYAPLAIIQVGQGGVITNRDISDQRCSFTSQSATCKNNNGRLGRGGGVDVLCVDNGEQ